MAGESRNFSRARSEKSSHGNLDGASPRPESASGARNIHLVSRFPDPCFLIEPDSGRVLDFNSLALELLGYEREELLAKTIFDLKPGLSREEFKSYIGQTQGQTFTALPPSRFLRRDRSNVFVEFYMGLTEVDGIPTPLVVSISNGLRPTISRSATSSMSPRTLLAAHGTP